MLIVNNGNCYIGLFEESILFKDRKMEVKLKKSNYAYQSN